MNNDIEYFTKLKLKLQAFNVMVLLGGSFLLFAILVPEGLAARLPSILDGLAEASARVAAALGLGVMGWMSWWCGRELELATVTLDLLRACRRPPIWGQSRSGLMKPPQGRPMEPIQGRANGATPGPG